jgi:hypothetical protein
VRDGAAPSGANSSRTWLRKRRPGLTMNWPLFLGGAGVLFITLALIWHFWGNRAAGGPAAEACRSAVKACAAAIWEGCFPRDRSCALLPQLRRPEQHAGRSLLPRVRHGVAALKRKGPARLEPAPFPTLLSGPTNSSGLTLLLAAGSRLPDTGPLRCFRTR